MVCTRAAEVSTYQKWCTDIQTSNHHPAETVAHCSQQLQGHSVTNHQQLNSGDQGNVTAPSWGAMLTASKQHMKWRKNAGLPFITTTLQYTGTGGPVVEHMVPDTPGDILPSHLTSIYFHATIVLIY